MPLTTVDDLREQLAPYGGDALLRVVTQTDPPIGYEIQSVASQSEFSLRGVFETEDEPAAPELVFITIALARGRKRPARKRKEKKE